MPTPEGIISTSAVWDAPTPEVVEDSTIEVPTEELLAAIAEEPVDEYKFSD